MKVNRDLLFPSTSFLLTSLVLTSLVFISSSPQLFAAERRVMPWDVVSLGKAPSIHFTTKRPASGVKSFFYEGAMYKGKPTWVFSYFGIPEGEPPKDGWPAMVCVHGGGGSAFPAWVKFWNKRGFAAIAMDVEGHLPGGNHFGVEGNHPLAQSHENAGPKRNGWFGDIALPDNQQWFYHAVSDVIRANSLLRSHPEINKERIGLTGISWGGTIVSTTAGVDDRFAFVIPVYGGGYIHKHEMTAEQFREYNSKWDPSAHLPYAKMPMLWVNSFVDPVFSFDRFQKSSATAGGPSSLSVRPFLIHGHGYGWEEVWEIVAFAEAFTDKKTTLPAVLGKPYIDAKDGLVHMTHKGGSDGLKRAWLLVSTSNGDWLKRPFAQHPCRVTKTEVISERPLPKNATAYCINTRDGIDRTVTSQLGDLTPTDPATSAPVTLEPKLKDHKVARRGWLRSVRLEVAADKKTVLRVFDSPREIGDRYSACVRGFVYPPKSGEYLFAISGDDMTKLFLSSDASPANKVLIAHTDEWAEPGNFEKFPSQKSKSIRLEGGTKYYIEAAHRESTGGDHLSVGWAGPGESAVAIIAGKDLSPFPAGNKGTIHHEVWLDPVAPPIKGTPAIAITSANDPTKPVPGGVRWFWREHVRHLQKTKDDNFELCFLGDSITAGWPADLLQERFGKYRPANFGIGGDRTENILFRLENGELLWTSPKTIVLLIGINNSGMNNSGEIAVGVASVIRKLRGMLPETKILLLAIFPTKDANVNKKTVEANRYLAKMDDGKMVRYLDFNAKFMDASGKLRNDVMRDGVHLNRNGYVIWADNIAAEVDKLMAPSK